MNKKLIIVSALTMALLWTTFAANMGSQMWGGVRMWGERPMMWQNMDQNSTMWLIDIDALSDTDKETVNNLLEENRSKTQELMDSVKNWETSMDEIKSQLEELWYEHMEAIKPYINDENLDKYEELVSNWPQTQWGPKWDIGWMMNENQMKKTHMYRYLQWELYNSIKEKFSNVDTEKLESVKTKIAAKISEIENSDKSDIMKQKYISIYREIEQVADEVINWDEYVDTADIIDWLLE